MSLYHNVLDEASDLSTDLNKAVKVWDWVRSRIDFAKFRARAAASRADNNRNVQMKVVLMEYASTWRSGDTLTNYYVPGTYINTACLQRDNRVMDYLHYQIADRDPRVQIYTRRKIVDGKEPHRFLRQLVVKFNVPQIPPESPILETALPPSPIEKLDEEYDVTKDVTHE